MAHGRATWKDLPMALKMSICCLSLASLVFIVGWLASGGAEYIVSSLIAALPLPNYSARSWLAPPYLFLTVHFIILLIWKLSDHKPHPGHPLPAVPKHSINLSVPAAAPAPAPAPAVQQGYYQWHPQQHPDLSHDDASCTTNDASDDRNSTASSSPLLIRRNERPPPAVLDKEIPTPSPPEQAVLVKEEERQEEEGELMDDVDDSMDATWRAIMAKTSRPVTAAATADLAIEPEMSAAGADDEMNQRFEEFIKKSRDQIMAGHG